MLPLANLAHASLTPHLYCYFSRELQALLDLNPIVRSYELSHDQCVTMGRIESLMASSILVVDVFAYDLPILLMEDVLPQNVVGMAQAIEDESRPVSLSVYFA